MGWGVSYLGGNPVRGCLYLVACSVAETREEGGEFSESRGVGFVFEYYFVETGN